MSTVKYANALAAESWVMRLVTLRAHQSPSMLVHQTCGMQAMQDTTRLNKKFRYNLFDSCTPCERIKKNFTVHAAATHVMQDSCKSQMLASL